MRFRNNKKGQALMEVLLAIGIISLCLVALTIAVVSAVRNARFATNYTLAKKYVQEGIEMARKERDRNSWADFTSNFSGEKGLDQDLEWNGCDSNNIGSFTRCLTFDSSDDSGEIATVSAAVSWSERSRDHTVEAVTFLTKWTR